MAVYKCPTCARRLSFPLQNGPTFVTACPVCGVVKTFTQDMANPVADTVQQTDANAQALVTTLSTYIGGQVVGYSDIEALIYGAMQEAVSDVIVDLGQGTLTTRVVSIVDAKKLLAASDPTNKMKLTTGELPITEYDIGGPGDFIRLVRIMGQHAQTNLPGRILHLFGKHRVFLTPLDHYCYPLQLDSDTFVMTHYNHDYDHLMEQKISADAQIAFLRTGECVMAEELSVHIANLVCESDRNWVQLFLTIVLLEKEAKSSCMAKRQGCFPMAGGGWKNRGSWGSGKNPNGTALGATEEIRRWMVAVLLREIFKSTKALSAVKKLAASDGAALATARTALKAVIESTFRASLGKL